MTRAERAAQIWSLLSFCARQRQTLTYDLLGSLIGVPRPGLGQLLEPIQSFCILRDLPPLTCIVVSSESGFPGEGFIGASDVPRAQQAVFAYDWISANTPTTEALHAAALELPSNGRSLSELQVAAVDARIG